MRNNQRFTAILAGLILLIPAAVFAQFQDPVTLSAEAKTSARAGEVVDIIVRAEMDDEWHIYAIYDVPEGPIASKISVSGDAVEKSGRVIEQEPIVEWDEGFEMETRFHKGNSEFTVPVLLKDDIEPGLISVTANVLYQVCNVSLCYPPREVEVPADTVCFPNDSDYRFLFYQAGRIRRAKSSQTGIGIHNRHHGYIYAAWSYFGNHAGRVRSQSAGSQPLGKFIHCIPVYLFCPFAIRNV